MKKLITIVANLLVFGWVNVLGLFAANLPKVLILCDNAEADLTPLMRQNLKNEFLVDQVCFDNPTVLLDSLRQGTTKYEVFLFNTDCNHVFDISSPEQLEKRKTEFRENLQKIIQIVREKGMEPLFFNKPSVSGNGQLNENIESLNRSTEAFLNGEKVTTIDFNSFCKNLRSSSKDNRSDNPSVLQNKKSEYLAEALKQWWIACAKNNLNVNRVKLWDQTPPAYEYSGEERVNGSARIDHVTVPEIERFYPQKREAATAVIFFPGGGYRFLGFLRNAKDLADNLDSLGIAVIGLKYRTGRTQDVSLLDAQRAVRYVRAHALEWGIDPNRIGVAGQSAGANLVLNLAGNYSNGDPNASDPVERESSRPDFMAVFSSWNFGSNESSFVFKQDVPPFFVRHAKDDSSFKLIQKVVAQLDEMGASKDVLFLEKGGHGAFELDPKNAGYKWPTDFVTWLRKQRLL